MKVKPIGEGGFDAVLDGSAMGGLAQTGRMNQSNGFGFGTFGSGRFGQIHNNGGIYQKRVTGYNQTGIIPGRPRISYYVKMRSYAPTNPRTEEQQSRRMLFAEARAAWSSLTDSEKRVYNQRATRQGRFGWRLFMSEYLKSH